MADINPKLRRLRNAVWRQLNPEQRRLLDRRSRIKRKFGLSIEEYEAALTRDCAICGSEDRLVLDHDHTSGQVRQALCSSCNTGLGMFGEDRDRLRAAIAYLELHGR